MRTCSIGLATLVALVGCNALPSSAGSSGDAGGGADARSQHDAPGTMAMDGPPAATGAIQIIVEPNGNKAGELVTAIAGAHTSVYVTFYELDATNLVDALVARAKAGVDVQVVLDSSTTTKAFNTPAYNTLKTAGAKVVWSNPTFTYTHEKCVIVDGAAAWIMTMNGNTSSPSANREFLAIDTDAADVAEATAVFKADHALQAITPVGTLVVANANARPALVALINSATTTLDLEGEEFSDTHSNGIVSAVAAAARRGVTVHVVIATGNVDATSVNTVKAAGAHVVASGPNAGNGTASNPYIHAKTIVVDCGGGTCARGFVGSENFTAGSLGYNREVGVIFDTASELAKVKTAIDTDFARGTAQ